MFLICHVIKQDHVINGSSDYNDTRPLRSFTTLSSLVIIGTVEVKI